MAPERDPQQTDPRARRLQRLREGAVDLALTLGQMAVFFLIFMAILLWSFPRGTGLTDLYGELVAPGDQRARLELDGPRGARDDVAVLASLSRSVKERPADAVTWREARAGMALGDQHAIQTAGRSTAAIRFDASNVLQMSENSLVIVQRPQRGQRDRAASLVVLGGRIRGRVEPTHGARPVEVLTANAASVIRAEGDRPAEYDITVDPQGEATLSVYSGVAEIRAGDRTAEVRSNQSLTVSPDAPLGRPDWIPQPAKPLEPADGQQLTFGASASQVRFRWSPAERADRYRLVIARDFDFDDVVYEIDADDTELLQGNLHTGRYYWRVDGVHGKARSLPGPTHTLELQRDDTPPALDVTLPDEVVEHDRFLLQGHTDPDARVTVGGFDVAVAPDGLFQLELGLRPGPNLIVVEALDPAGNVAYHSRYVHAKY